MSQHAAYPHLFSPLQIGKLTVKNRIVSSGHDTVMAHEGRVTDRLIAYHEARAMGGVGLIVMQVVGVHESARYTSHVLMATDETYVDGYRRLAETVHSHGTGIVAQVFHPGREIMESQDGSAPVALAPSAVPTERFHVMPREMPTALVEEIVAGYGDAARRLCSAGLDGVEIVASHGYLPAQFLNPGTNQRADRYGGDADRRLTFLREVVACIRDRVGAEFVVGLRVSADEMSEGGLGPEDTTAACSALAREGGLDYVSVCAGSSATSAGSVHIAPPMSEPSAYVAPLAARIKAAVGLPVMVAGRINQPQEAEQVIATGQADACAMTRALICDPQMPDKALRGDTEQIRACIACNQACIGHFHAGYPISCIQHPETGRELVYGVRGRAERSRRVIVVGGGPAGLKAASVAAERGHNVTLYEEQPRLGGQVLLAESLPGRAEFGGAITNLEGEARRAGVKIITRTAVDSQLLHSEAPDVVVIATGARPRRPKLELMDQPVVLTAWDVIRGSAVPRGGTLVADWRGDWIGLGVARLLAERGHRVTLAVNGDHSGERLQQYVRNVMLAAAYRASVKIVTNVRIFGADEDTCYLQNTLTGEPVIVEDIRSVVLAEGHDPVDDLTRTLHDFEGEMHAIGDCLSPRSVEEAVLEGLKVASAI